MTPTPQNPYGPPDPHDPGGAPRDEPWSAPGPEPLGAEPDALRPAGQQPYAPQDPYGQPPYGQPPSAPQDPYGQPPYGQPPYGTPNQGGYPPPYTGQPGYGGYPGYRPDPNQTNGLAIASLVVSIAGIVTCGASAVVGLVLGIVALGQIKRDGTRGRGLALAGVIVGGALCVLAFLGFLANIAMEARYP